jgi:hypothetical protein
MDLIQALKIVTSYEPTLELKLYLLTEIGLNSTSDELFSATEEVRNELASEEKI